MTERLPGVAADIVKRLFARGEAFDSEGFVTFFTDKQLYQFANAAPAFDKAAIKASTDAFFASITFVYHDIKMLWEVGDVVFVEMDVSYGRKDGSTLTLPCFDIFRLEGELFSELRIFMDANPLFDPSIPLSDTSSVMAVYGGEKIAAPQVMKKFFAEHPEGIERIKTGFTPKWMTS